jgi:hypothetical protein
MPASPSWLSAAALALLACASQAAAQASIVPADPVQFERISLRQTVDSCAFDEDNVQVSYERGSGVIKVVQALRQCFAPGPPAVVDIQLGAFPRGEYRVEIHLGHDQPAIERLDFTVQGLVQPAIFPPPPAPLANYTGIWWTPTESGWGLSLHQSRTHELFGALYVFGVDGQSRWYTLGAGRWQSSTLWQGEVFESTGPFWAAASWNPASVQHLPAGTVELDFAMLPGQLDTARLSYRIGGTTVTKRIARIRY